MLDTEVYAKTDAGREEIRSRTQGLSMPARAILLMVDGKRTVGAMRALIAGSKAPADILDTLAAQGLIEPRGGVAPTPAAPATPPVPVPPPAIRSAPPRADSRGMDPPPGRPVRDVPLDLELPTINGPVTLPPVPQAGAPSTGSRPSVAAIDAPVPAAERYERLYTVMNEIVRDFLAPHRRYFFQLKIERCTTADELTELLHGLQTTLAKARGEAFASDVIARIRIAAG